MNIADNLQKIQKEITDCARVCGRDPQSIQLIAVSKHHPIASIQEAMACGQILFGENYIQEAEKKCKKLPGASFHFIGHIQSNKARQAASLFSMVETVDRFKLAKLLNKHLEQLEKDLNILVQVNIGQDPVKSGISAEQTGELLQQIAQLPRVHAKGLMTIPPLQEDKEKTRNYFKSLRLLSIKLAEKNLFADNSAVELSMGMSQDFSIAIEEGATLIRVGTSIFGPRG